MKCVTNRIKFTTLTKTIEEIEGLDRVNETTAEE